MGVYAHLRLDFQNRRVVSMHTYTMTQNATDVGCRKTRRKLHSSRRKTSIRFGRQRHFETPEQRQQNSFTDGGPTHIFYSPPDYRPRQQGVRGIEKRRDSLFCQNVRRYRRFFFIITTACSRRCDITGIKDA